MILFTCLNNIHIFLKVFQYLFFKKTNVQMNLVVIVKGKMLKVKRVYKLRLNKTKTKPIFHVYLFTSVLK